MNSTIDAIEGLDAAKDALERPALSQLFILLLGWGIPMKRDRAIILE